jgi:hypothetical protein
MKERKRYNIGDKILGEGAVQPAGGQFYVYEVLEIKETTRFGAPDQLLTVKITTTEPGSTYSETTKRWTGQLL